MADIGKCRLMVMISIIQMEKMLIPQNADLGLT